MQSSVDTGQMPIYRFSVSTANEIKFGKDMRSYGETLSNSFGVTNAKSM